VTLGGGESDDDLQAAINVTPLVDVLLVLLVIFMVVTPMLKRDLPVDLPLAASGQDAEIPPDELTLTATADGHLLLNGQAIAEGDLADAVRDRPVVFLEADRTLSYARVVDLMDACRSAGVARIGVVTRESRGTS
jgi:biopolymer transport protein ExbD